MVQKVKCSVLSSVLQAKEQEQKKSKKAKGETFIQKTEKDEKVKN
jgi:hypothetical protein